MKKLLIGIFLLFLVHFSFGQRFKFGVRAGVNACNLQLEKTFLDIRNVTLSSVSDYQVGYHGGIFMRLEFPVVSLFIQPEILFSSTRGHIRLKDTNMETIINQNYNKLDIPIMLGFKLGPFHLQVGPVGSYLITKDTDFKQFDIKQTINDFIIGYQAGVGIDIIKKIIIDIKYEQNLSKLGNGLQLSNENFKFNSSLSQIILSLGYFF